jgi:ATPase subunit of ABC transporter with duplicated ATPase domains
MRLRNIKKSFGETEVLKSIDLDIPSDGRIGLVGMNGSGKTTLAKIIAGLEGYDNGMIDTFQTNLKSIYMKQSSEFDQDPESYFSENAENFGDILKTGSLLGLTHLKEWENDLKILFEELKRYKSGRIGK